MCMAAVVLPLRPLPCTHDRSLAGTLHSVGDRAKATAGQPREELAKAPEERRHQQAEPLPEVEAKLSHGDIPFSTEELLAKKAGSAGAGADEPGKAGGSGAAHEHTEDLLDKARVRGVSARVL